MTTENVTETISVVIKTEKQRLYFLKLPSFKKLTSLIYVLAKSFYQKKKIIIKACFDFKNDFKTRADSY